MESRLEEIFSMGISCMSLAVYMWLVEDRKCSAAVWTVEGLVEKKQAAFLNFCSIV